jgi:L-lysine 6-transaminase
MVLSLKKSFHGLNSWGFITDRFAATSVRMEYYPKNDWLNVSFEELETYFKEGSVENLVAIVLEPIQCTAGDLYIPIDQILRIRELCSLHNVCFIVDEIQTGFGVTGSMWYSNKINVTPDILVFGKKAQISGICANDKYSECIVSPIKKLGVTYDGDLIDAIRSTYILKAYEEGNLVDDANKKSLLFREMLSHKVLNYRSTGFLIAFDFETKEIRDRFTNLCFQNGLICNGTGEKAVRMRPNLAISQSEIDDASLKLDKVFQLL